MFDGNLQICPTILFDFQQSRFFDETDPRVFFPNLSRIQRIALHIRR